MADQLFSPPVEVAGAAGRYRVESLLGRGGFGESYRARASSGAEVTLKVLRVERLESWKALDLFDREARALAALDHPRLPRLIEVFVSDGTRARPLAGGETVTSALAAGPARVVLVQSYVPGRSLQALLDGGQRLDAPAAERLARELLDILEYLHGRDPPIIHRDIKPSNIILDGEGRAHLIDFGAIHMRQGAEGGSTMVGTLGYFPHEQILGRAVPSSDLYALGMTLVVALTGKPPEDQPHDAASGTVQPPAKLPLALGRFLRGVLQVAPGSRPQSARAARELLDGVVALMGRPPLAVTPKYAVLSLPAKRVHQAVYGATLAGGLGLAGVVNGLMFNRFSESKLVEIAPLWVAPIVFGLAGFYSLPRKTSLALAAGATALGLGLLLFFLYGIFPSL